MFPRLLIFLFTHFNLSIGRKKKTRIGAKCNKNVNQLTDFTEEETEFTALHSLVKTCATSSEWARNRNRILYLIWRMFSRSVLPFLVPPLSFFMCLCSCVGVPICAGRSVQVHVETRDQHRIAYQLCFIFFWRQGLPWNLEVADSARLVD